MNRVIAETVSQVKSYTDSTHSIVRWDIEKFNLFCPKSTYFSTRKTLESASQTSILTLSDCLEDGKPQTIELKWHPTLCLELPVRGEHSAMSHNYIKLVFETSLPHPKLSTLVLNVSILGQNEVVLYTLILPPGQYCNIFPPTEVHLFDSPTLWANENAYLVDGTLRLKIELELGGHPYAKQLSGQRQSQESHGDDIIEGLAQLLKTGEDADVTIFCGTQTFKVHSLVLKARSPVLERMLKSGLIESTNKSIKIDDVDPADFEALLKYLYTGKIPESVPPAEGTTAAAARASACASPFIGLMQVADKYEVLRLRDFCFEQIVENICLENAGEITASAYLHSAPQRLRYKIFSFCLENWNTLSNDVNFKTWTQQNPAAFNPVGRPAND